MNALNARIVRISVRCMAGAAIVSVLLPLKMVYANSLSLDAVLDLAIERDLEIAQSRDRESMFRETARFSAALPPPTLTLSATNLPVDTFAIDQEPMTQLQARFSQKFPAGNSRLWRAKSKELSAEESVINRSLRSAMLRLQLRSAWADGWMAQASLSSLEANRSVFEQTLATTRASYSAGIRHTRQREVLGAEASLTRLADRIEHYSMLLDTTREIFAEWLTPAELDQLSFADDADLPTPPYSQRFDPAQHPTVVLAEAKRNSAEAEMQLARELNKGSRGISLSYGFRADQPNGAERADFVSLGFTMDLASLRSNANSARRSAAASKVGQAQNEADLKRARLSRDYRQTQAKLIRLNSRRSLYRNELIPQYRQQADATRRSFANDEARFIELQLVLIDLLISELEVLAVDAEIKKSSAVLEYLLTTTVTSGERN